MCLIGTSSREKMREKTMRLEFLFLNILYDLYFASKPDETVGPLTCSQLFCALNQLFCTLF